jgi:hypothetical protein
VLVSLGIPGCLGFFTLLGTATWTAIRRQRWEGAAAVVAATVVSTGFNGWDQVPVTLVMVGAAVVLALAGGRSGGQNVEKVTLDSSGRIPAADPSS